jgi:hypothetical protein
MMGGWSRQMPAALAKKHPLPLVDFLGQPERPGSRLGRRIEALRAIGGGGGYAGNEENEGGHPPKSARKKRRDFEL